MGLPKLPRRTRRDSDARQRESELEPLLEQLQYAIDREARIHERESDEGRDALAAAIALGQRLLVEGFRRARREARAIPATHQLVTARYREALRWLLEGVAAKLCALGAPGKGTPLESWSRLAALEILGLLLDKGAIDLLGLNQTHQSKQRAR